jgi:hypothetical protein
MSSAWNSCLDKRFSVEKVVAGDTEDDHVNR